MPSEEEIKKIYAHLNFHIASLLAEGNSQSKIVDELVNQGWDRAEANALVENVKKTLPN